MTVNAAERLNRRAAAGEYPFESTPLLAPKELETSVYEALRRHPSIDIDRVIVRGTDRGEALLEGEFPSELDKVRALEVVTAVIGVASVTDDTVIRRRSGTRPSTP